MTGRSFSIPRAERGRLVKVLGGGKQVAREPVEMKRRCSVSFYRLSPLSLVECVFSVDPEYEIRWYRVFSS